MCLRKRSKESQSSTNIFFKLDYENPQKVQCGKNSPMDTLIQVKKEKEMKEEQNVTPIKIIVVNHRDIETNETVPCCEESRNFTETTRDATELEIKIPDIKIKKQRVSIRGELGYGLKDMIETAMNTYSLDPSGVQTDYWSASMQTWITQSYACEDDDISWGSDSHFRVDFGIIPEGIVREDDLITDESG